jgi:hypothetical protein
MVTPLSRMPKSRARRACVSTGREAGGRLVHQHQRGTRRERAGDLQQAKLPEGERVGTNVGQRVKAHEVEPRVRLRAEAGVLGQRGGQAERGGQERAVRAGCGTDHDVLELIG